MRYVTPAFLFLITVWWVITILPGYLAESRWTSWVAREVLVAIMAVFCFLVYFQDKKRRKK
jgi:apolipoprotein N-acyltransferase